MTTHAPVAMFIYKRPNHTRRTLEALARNYGAADTDLVIFADGPRTQADIPAVEETRRVAAAATGFRSVELVARDGNIGLARNIADGVTAVMERYGRAIVMEDDLETARGFLEFMNASLEKYRDEPRVWHISGWNYAIDPAELPDAFLWQVMNCWGWASWADRWAHYSREPQEIRKSWSRTDRKRFNLGGAHDFYAQVEDNLSGAITTWAIFWYATIFEAGGLCVNPARSFVRNIGLDGSGENCAPLPEEPLDPELLFDGELPDRIEADPVATSRIRAYLTLPAHERAMWRARRIVVSVRRRLRPPR